MILILPWFKINKVMKIEGITLIIRQIFNIKYQIIKKLIEHTLLCQLRYQEHYLNLEKLLKCLQSALKYKFHNPKLLF